MPIQNSLVQQLVEPLMGLDGEELQWRCDRWRDHLQTVPAAEVDAYHAQVLAEIARIEGNDGPPEPPPPEYHVLMAIYNTLCYVRDMRRLGIK